MLVFTHSTAGDCFVYVGACFEIRVGPSAKTTGNGTAYQFISGAAGHVGRGVTTYGKHGASQDTYNIANRSRFATAD